MIRVRITLDSGQVLYRRWPASDVQLRNPALMYEETGATVEILSYYPE